MSRVNFLEVDVSDGTSQAVLSTPCEFVGAWVTTVLSAHTVDVTNGASGTVVRQFAASSAVNSEVDGMNVYCENGIVLACNAAGTGKIVVAYRTP